MTLHVCSSTLERSMLKSTKSPFPQRITKPTGCSTLRSHFWAQPGAAALLGRADTDSDLPPSRARVTLCAFRDSCSWAGELPGNQLTWRLMPAWRRHPGWMCRVSWERSEIPFIYQHPASKANCALVLSSCILLTQCILALAKCYHKAQQWDKHKKALWRERFNDFFVWTLCLNPQCLLAICWE